TLDPEAPALNDYLGEIGHMGLDVAAERGNIKIAGGIQKYTIGCNWKLAADNVWDWYHPAIAHASSSMASGNTRMIQQGPRPHLVTFGEYGHAFAGPELTEATAAQEAQPDWRSRPEVKAEVGFGLRFHQNAHPHIFPNMWLTFPGGSIQVSMRMPKGPKST